MCNIPELSAVSSLVDMIKELFKLGTCSMYPMVDRLLRLVVTLPVSTATVERVFSGVKLCKTRTHNKMGNDYLRSYVTIYIEKELAAKISSLDIMEAFDQGGPRRGKFKLI
jgi:hypothetical protein